MVKQRDQAQANPTESNQIKPSRSPNRELKVTKERADRSLSPGLPPGRRSGRRQHRPPAACGFPRKALDALFRRSLIRPFHIIRRCRLGGARTQITHSHGQSETQTVQTPQRQPPRGQCLYRARVCEGSDRRQRFSPAPRQSQERHVPRPSGTHCRGLTSPAPLSRHPCDGYHVRRQRAHRC